MSNLLNLPFLTSNNVTLVIWLAVVDAVLLLFVIIFVIRFLSKKPSKAKVNNDDWFNAVGGKDNIKEINALGSRLSLSLNNQESIDRVKLKALGVSSVLVMSNKVTLVIEGKAEKIAETLKGSL